VILEPPPFEEPPLPDDMLADDVALVTGGGSGMGLSMATGLAQAGARIALFGRTKNTIDKGVKALCALGADVIGIAGDVRDPDAICAAFGAAERAFGPVSILANNAGGNYPVLAEQMSPGQWRSITRIAIDGTFLCSTEFARRCSSASRGGAIVNNSAQYIDTGFPGDAHSAAAKAAVATMTKALAREWAAIAIRVNCIAAGFFPHERSGLDNPEKLARDGQMIPAGRTGRIREFGWAAAFLCSPLAAGISGETLVMDGGDRLRRSLLNPAYVPPRERREPWDYQ